MRAPEAVSRIPQHVLSAFLSRLPPSLIDKVAVLQNPTSELREELDDAKARGLGWGDVSLFAQNVRQRQFARRPLRAGDSGKARVEENYFYSSRRFPALANNTIGAGALVPGTFGFFTKGLNDQGDSAGFPSGFTLGTPETNMEVGGGIPQGTSFVFQQLGISFDSDIRPADLAIMLDAVTLGFAKSGGQFALSHGPLKMWPSGMGMAGFAAGATGSAPEFSPGFLVQGATNGSPDIRSVRTLRIPRILREKESFNYNMVVTRSTRAKDGATIALSNFVVATIWLFGGQRNVIQA
jgi:hypothetical protein